MEVGGVLNIPLGLASCFLQDPCISVPHTWNSRPKPYTKHSSTHPRLPKLSISPAASERPPLLCTLGHLSSLQPAHCPFLLSVLLDGIQVKELCHMSSTGYREALCTAWVPWLLSALWDPHRHNLNWPFCSWMQERLWKTDVIAQQAKFLPCKWLILVQPLESIWSSPNTSRNNPWTLISVAQKPKQTEMLMGNATVNFQSCPVGMRWSYSKLL